MCCVADVPHLIRRELFRLLTIHRSRIILVSGIGKEDKLSINGKRKNAEARKNDNARIKDRCQRSKCFGPCHTVLSTHGLIIRQWVFFLRFHGDTSIMTTDNSAEDDHHRRSDFVREFIQRSVSRAAPSLFDRKIPKRIVQFWDNLNRLPSDVRECIETWSQLEEQGFERLLFDKQQAGDFINRKLGIRYKRAYDNCYHPAMQSDFFRLCYIFEMGGCYIDADDVYNGAQIQHLFSDERLKIQPLCYDMSTHMMVPPSIFTKHGGNVTSWIFYFNNNPLIAGSGHPVIERALIQATLSLEKDLLNGLPEIQSATGPGNLTKSIFDAVTKNGEIEETLLLLSSWEDIAKSRWELSYRNDARNWRLSNCQSYKG